ncbi:MAG: BREX system ATP-binding domain-containing protein, partial [Brasilonema sp.]
VQEYMGPVMRLNPLTEAEILTLLRILTDIHAINFGYEKTLTNGDLKNFVQEIVNRLGAESLLTPSEIVRDFLSVLNILYQNSNLSFGTLIHGADFQPTVVGKDSDVDEDDAAEFSL